MALIDIRLAHLRNVLLVADSRSYAAAARRAFRSQPALSHSIRQVEQKLGAPIFEPQSRTELTPFGERCLPILREAVARLEHALQDVRRLADASTGHQAIAILPSVAQQWLPWLLRDFRALYPGIELRVLAEDSGSVQRLVAEAAVDLGISSQPSADSKLIFEPLMRDQFGLLCRKDHPYASLASVAWARLEGEPLLGSTMHRQLDGSPVARLLAAPRVYVSNLPTLVALVRAGIGVQPLPAMAYPKPQPDLAFVPLIRPVETRQIGSLLLAGRSLLPASAALIGLIKAGLRQNGRAQGDTTACRSGAGSPGKLRPARARLPPR
jgi:DNA-binding transcriptional LysR family regulator